jgi:hypothetical protein
MKEGLAKAPQGAPYSADTEVEQKLGLKHLKRESAHFLVESPHLKESELAGLIQHAEHAYAMYHKILGQDDLFGGQKMRHVVLKDKAQHDRFVDLFRKGSPAQIDLAKKSKGGIGFPLSEHYQDTQPLPGVEDWVVHSMVQELSPAFAEGNHHWLHEGAAYHFTRLIKGSAATYCVDLAGTGIKVSIVDPGYVMTEFAMVRFKGDAQRAAKTYAGFTPLSPDDVADAVAYIVAHLRQFRPLSPAPV